MSVSAKKKQIGVISALAKGANIGSIDSGKIFLISVGFSVTMLACADPVVAAQKPWPAGIFDLPAADHPRQPYRHYRRPSLVKRER